MEPPIDPLRAFRLLARSDLEAPAPTLGAPAIRVNLGVGHVLDERFELIELLAQGGMGRVFRARDAQLGREVAIKVLALLGAEPTQRFLREAQLTARLVHPHILRVHACGQSDGWSYIVYELIPEAQTLADAFAVRDLEGRLDLFEQALAGVAAAHDAGVVHRDLKPHNVLVRPDGSAAVADFGVAHVAQSSLTVSGQVLGTPAYMAPEQLRGEAIEPNADVWSLGVMLYELLYERHPFSDALQLPLLMQRICDAQVDYPPGPPAPLLRTVRRCLEARPARRLPDAAALLEAVRAARRQEPVPQTRKLPVWPLLLPLLLALGVGGALWRSAPDPRPPVDSGGTPPPPPAEVEPTAELPRPVERASWSLPDEPGPPHQAAFLGERLLVCLTTQTLLFGPEGEELRAWPQRLSLIGRSPEALWFHDGHKTYRLDRGSETQVEVLGLPAAACDPVHGRLLVLGERELLTFDARGEPLGRLQIPAGREVKQLFAAPTRVQALINDPDPRLFYAPWSGGTLTRNEHFMSPGSFKLETAPGGDWLALSGQTGFVWLYPGDLNADPVRCRRDRSQSTEPFVASLSVAHLEGVRQVVFYEDRVLSWARSDEAAEVAIWNRRGELLGTRAPPGKPWVMALGPGGRLAWVYDDQVRVGPIEDLLAE
ncbi:MAG: serine/threonine-protein kinase [Planctomycetota bacterium]